MEYKIAAIDTENHLAYRLCQGKMKSACDLDFDEIGFNWLLTFAVVSLVWLYNIFF